MKPWKACHLTDIHLGSPKSYRFNPGMNENWETAKPLIQTVQPELILNGGDVARDGDTHDFELQMVKDDFESTFTCPIFSVPGNMDCGNKHASQKGAFKHNDPELNYTSELLARYASYFGPTRWSFIHKNVRFTGFFGAEPGSGIPEEDRFWHFMERLPSLPRATHHVVVMHYALFMEHPDEPNGDMMKRERYHDWYFAIDHPHRDRIIDLFKAANVNIVLSGHIHIGVPEKVFDGIRYYKCHAVGNKPQMAHRWPDSDRRNGFHTLHIKEDGIDVEFVPIVTSKRIEDGYGPSGHPPLENRDYAAAWEPDDELIASMNTKLVPQPTTLC